MDRLVAKPTKIYLPDDVSEYRAFVSTEEFHGSMNLPNGPSDGYVVHLLAEDVSYRRKLTVFLSLLDSRGNQKSRFVFKNSGQSVVFVWNDRIHRWQIFEAGAYVGEN